MNRKALWNVKEGKSVQEDKPAGRHRGAQRIFMATSAIAGAVLLIVIIAGMLCAQSYPSKPIRLIIPMSAGGTQDIIARIIGQKLAERLGQPVVPENRGGSGGNIALEIAAKARPDGYTIVQSSASIAISPSLYRKLNYDTAKDFAPITLCADVPFVMLVRPSLPIKNLKELVEYARANPGKLNFGSAGMGTATHLAFELLKSLTKINIIHVPYKGGGQSLVGLAGGEIDMLVIGPTTAQPQIQAGKVRALAVLSKERLWSLPNIPTAKEAGIDNFEVTAWNGILAPAGTPREIINRLNTEWVASVAMPDTKEQIQNAGAVPLSATPEEFAKLIKADTERWAKVIKEANISID
jgi:tripartite-type tricarboxylate transporter receptor subunit TctC